MNNNIITIGGSKEFNDMNALKKIDTIVKKNKISKDNLIVYGYADGYMGAFAIAKVWAENNGVRFEDGSPKKGSDWNTQLAERNIKLAKHSKLLINLRVNDYKTGGKGLIETFEVEGVPVEVVSLTKATTKKAESTSKLTPSEKRKGELPSKEALEKSVAIYSKVAQRLLEHRCLMLDTETTGLGKDDEVVEIAIGDCSSGIIIFESLIKPSIKMKPAASEANGITDKMLKDAPTIDEIWDKIDAIVGNRVVLASHSTSETEWFDERLLNQSLDKHGLVCGFIWKDLQPIYRLYSCQLKASDYPLKTEGMCMQLGVEAGSHRAKNDVLAQIRILQAMAKGVMPDFTV